MSGLFCAPKTKGWVAASMRIFTRCKQPLPNLARSQSGIDRRLLRLRPSWGGPFSMSEPTIRLGRVGILWRSDEAARRSVTPETSRFKAVFAALADVGVDAEPVGYEDDGLDAVGAQLITLDGVLVWVNPIHEGRNRGNLDALLREVAARGVWVSAHPDVILKMGTKEVLHRTRTMSWGCDTAISRTPEAMCAELPTQLAAGPRVIKRNRGNGGQGVWKVAILPTARHRR